MLLGGAIGTLFNGQFKESTLLDIAKNSFGGNFLQAPLINAAVTRLAIGGLTGSMPGIETIASAALGTSGFGGSGTSFALKEYGIND